MKKLLLLFVIFISLSSFAFADFTRGPDVTITSDAENIYFEIVPLNASSLARHNWLELRAGAGGWKPLVIIDETDGEGGIVTWIGGIEPSQESTIWLRTKEVAK